MGICVVCGKKVDIETSDARSAFILLTERADYYGMEALTENQQVLVEGKVCSMKCYHELA